MTGELVQITTRRGRIDRVPRGQDPTIELDLDDRQYVAGIELSSNRFDSTERKTVDWSYTVYIVTRVGGPS